jgi:glycerophosphoryl diester phosphodiesterase
MKDPYKIDLPLGFDIEGHRGCRGSLPENSISAFIKALELGVTTLEMDLVISKDKKVVVSHEPYFSHEICLTPEGKNISKEEESSFNIYQMNYEQIKKFDCGTKPHPRFPQQQKIFSIKPLFKDVIDISENHIKEKDYSKVQYNVEIKSTPEGDNLFHPEPGEYAELIYEILKEKNILERTIIQSFDIRALQYIHNKYPFIALSFLIENTLTPEQNLKNLGFTPNIYSPEYILVDQHLISFTKKQKMKIIPWTVNEPEKISRLVKLGVDGVITDYPDLFNKLK